MHNMVSALTYQYNKIESQIVTDVTIKNSLGSQTIVTKGLWDTGAQNSVITQKAAQKLGLVVLGKTKTRGVHGVKEVNVYSIGIVLNNPDIAVNCTVTECDELSNDGSVDLLLGMNVISMGDFVISNYEGKTSMTFRVPSLERKDFVAEIKEQNRILKMHQTWAAHGNNKCPCGSGKLFKNCHGKNMK